MQSSICASIIYQQLVIDFVNKAWGQTNEAKCLSLSRMNGEWAWETPTERNSLPLVSNSGLYPPALTPFHNHFAICVIIIIAAIRTSGSSFLQHNIFNRSPTTDFWWPNRVGTNRAIVLRLLFAAIARKISRTRMTDGSGPRTLEVSRHKGPWWVQRDSLITTKPELFAFIIAHCLLASWPDPLFQRDWRRFSRAVYAYTRSTADAAGIRRLRISEKRHVHTHILT